VLEHPFSCRSPYQHCPQIVGSYSAVRSSTEPWFIKSSGPQRNGPGSTAHLQPTETLYATCSLLFARNTPKKNWFIDYVLQRIVSSVSVCRRRERLTHVECRMCFLARCHARALHTYAALFCCGPAGCVCIDWVACRLGCICKGRVCGKDLEGGTSSGREAENMGCVVRRVDM
jgi:hypothetical protein